MSPKLKIYGVVLGIFVLGAGAGGAAGYAVATKQLAEVLGDDRPALGDARRFAAMARELDLTREQRQKVRAIMERHRDENRELMRAMGVRLQVHSGGIGQGCRAELTLRAAPD